MKGVRRRAKQIVRNVPAAIMALCTVLLANQALAGDSLPPWSARPLMNGAWQEASQEQILSLVYKFRNYVPNDKQPLVDNITRLRALSLSCHQDVVLFEGETRDQSGQAGVMAFLLHTKGVTLLDGSSDHIHRMNAINPPAIRTHAQVQTYLKLFTGAMTGEESNFRILETPQELVWKNETIKGSYHDLVRKITPLELRPNGDTWTGTAVVQYGKYLFITTFVLTADGHVTMEDAHPIEEILPIAATRYTGLLRYDEF